MATMTYRPGAIAAAAKSASPAAPRKPGVWRRILAAMQDSRRRQAEIEIRRVRALMADADPGFKDALLPFKGE
jgi:ribosomal protein L18E